MKEATLVDLMIKLQGLWESRDHLLDMVEAEDAGWRRELLAAGVTTEHTAEPWVRGETGMDAAS